MTHGNYIRREMVLFREAFYSGARGLLKVPDMTGHGGDRIAV
jgi:hypothetical protein